MHNVMHTYVGRLVDYEPKSIRLTLNLIKFYIMQHAYIVDWQCVYTIIKTNPDLSSSLDVDAST